MSIYDNLVKEIRVALSKTETGKKFLAGWSDFMIKRELKEPCFFGAKAPIKIKEKGIRHVERIAEFKK